jgi:Rad3-related DNA helicase
LQLRTEVSPLPIIAGLQISGLQIFLLQDKQRTKARMAHMKAAGENWFGSYVLPQAVLRLKQGIGRLLRTRDDRGVMAILDTRLHTKSYGKTVLNALPPARRTSNIRDVERFFAEEPDI